MAERYPGGVISKTPPTVTGPTGGEGGSASGVWTLDTMLAYRKANAWPLPLLPRALYAWGRNNLGQLGDNAVASKSSPTQVGSLTDWQNVSAGNTFSISTKTNGTLWSWGSGSLGRTGQNDVLNKSSPVQIGSLTNWSNCFAGNVHALSIKYDSTIWSWGQNGVGALGDGTTVDKSSPVQIGALTNWRSATAGSGGSSLSVKTDNTLWSWGNNQEGQLGLGDVVARSSPVQVGALTDWANVSCGPSSVHTIAVKTGGTLWAWGRGFQGALGSGNTIDRSSPIQIGALTNWSTVSTGSDRSAAIKTDGTFWSWGNGGFGFIGDNTVVNKSSPVQIGALTNWSTLSVGSNQTLAVKTDGTLWAWGSNDEGRLGDNTIVNKSSPVQIGASTNWFKISTSVNHSISTTRG